MHQAIVQLFGVYQPIMVGGQAFTDWGYIAEIVLFGIVLWGLLIIVRSVISKL